jgi:hypothetical protein
MPNLHLPCPLVPERSTQLDKQWKWKVQVEGQCRLAMTCQPTAFEAVTLTFREWLACRRTEQLFHRPGGTCKAPLVSIVRKSMHFLPFPEFGAKINMLQIRSTTSELDSQYQCNPWTPCA